LSKLVIQLPIFVNPEDWEITRGWLPAILSPAAIEQATASLEAGTYSSCGCAIQALIKLLAKLQGTTHMWVNPLPINPPTNVSESNKIINSRQTR
jgi:hypothetical protein